MRSDYLGNPVSLTSDAAVAAVDRFVEAFLSYEASAAEIIAAADAHPSSALLNSYAAMLWLLLEAAEAPARASPYLSRAREAASRAHPRERWIVDFVVAWFGDDVPEALSIADSILKAWPRDLLILKMRQYHDFNRGDFPAMLKAAVNVAPAADDAPQLHGMLAFGYEQCHLLDEAEAAARRALALKRKEPWAQHALAHVMLTQGRIDEGVAFLEGVRDTWTGLNSFMDTHLWWHLALFYMSQGRFRDALAAYDNHCWAQAKDYSQDQIGAVSLLARLEIAGVEVGDRWTELADYLVSRASDVVQPFLTLQYLYGLARAGRPEADTLLTAVRRAALEAPDFVRETWREVALPAAEGLVAHARGDHVAALRGLRVALPRLTEIGGSHAQRDLFEQLILQALIRAGRLSEAQQTLELRRASDPDGVPLNRALAEVYGRLGLLEEAAKARARVERRLAARA
jgi:tetratricopeptide (TPR) repeat protein